MTKKKADSQPKDEPKATQKDEAGAINTPPEVSQPQKEEKQAKTSQKQAKQGKKQDMSIPDPAELAGLDLLKAKLRRKFHLLKNEPLNYDDREQLLTVVCTILGMNRPSLDVILVDL